MLPFLLQLSKYCCKVIVCVCSNELSTLNQSQIGSFIHLLFPVTSSAFRMASSVSFYFSASHSQAPLVKLGSGLKFHTLFNVLLVCLFLFMPTLFMWFLIITALCFSSLLSTSTSRLCHTHLAVSLTQLDFLRERQKKRHHWPLESPSLPPVILQYSEIVSPL